MTIALHLHLLATGLRENGSLALRLVGGRFCAAKSSRSRYSGWPGVRPRTDEALSAPLSPEGSNEETGGLHRSRADVLRAKAALLRAVKVGIIAFFVLAIGGLSAFGVGLWAMYEPPKSFETKHLRNSRPAITDRSGELVGAAPGFRQTSAAAATDAGDDEARMAALMVRDVPPTWWDVAVALEDRRFGKFGWIYGIDVFALPNLIVGRRGGSTLAMMLVGNLSGDKARENDAHGGRGSRLLAKAKRKLREISSTPALVAATSEDDYRWLKRLAATHLPVMFGEIGGSTVGIASGGWVMFGKTPMELSPGEQAIFAAALKRNIVIKKEPDDKVRRDWAYVKQRATRGLALAYPEGDARREQGIAEIEAMPDTPPLFFDDSLPLTARAHVVYRRTITAKTVATEAQAELADRYGLKALAEMPLRGYSLTLNSMDNFHFKQQMDRIGEALTEKLGRQCRLFVPLARDGFQDSLYQQVTGKPQCAPADLPKGERAQVLAVLANERGEIVRFYQSGSQEPIYAGVLGRTSNDGRYSPDSEIRDVGSVSKIAAAILLASEGDTPTHRYCRRRFEGRLDSDGTTGFDSCGAPGAMIDAREAFARSSNLAILWRLRQIPNAKLQRLCADLGLKLPTDVDPAYALAFGQVKAAPRQIHNLMHMAGRIVLDQGQGSGRPIHVVYRLDAAERNQPTAGKDIVALGRLPIYLASEEARQYLREVLGAVLTHPRGTLRFLRAYTQGGSGGAISAHIGKTGTPVNQGNLVSDKFITGSLVENGHYYSYLVMVRAPNPGKYPLGKRLSAEHFGPLVTILLDQIQAVSDSINLGRNKLVTIARSTPGVAIP